MLMVAVAAQAVSLGLIVALLADLQEDRGLPTWGLGLIAGAAFLTAFVGHLTLSRFPDRGYSRTMLLLGSALAVVALVWMAYATPLWQLIAARALLGLAEGAYVPAARRTVIDWGPDRPGLELGRLFAATVVGFILGPPLGAVLAELSNLQAPFLVVAGLIAATTPFLFRFRIKPVVATGAKPALLPLLRSRPVRAGVMIAASFFYIIGVLDAILARLLTDLGASTLFIGIGFTVFLLPLAVLAPFGGRIADRYPPARVGLIAVVISIPFIVLYGQVGGPLALVIVSGVHSALIAVIEPAAASSVARGSPPEQLAVGQGLMEAAGLLVAAVAAVSAAPIYQSIGAGWLFAIAAIVNAGLAAAVWAVTGDELTLLEAA